MFNQPLKPQYNNNWQNSDAKRQSPQSISSGTPDPSGPPYNANYHMHNGNSQVRIILERIASWPIERNAIFWVYFAGTARSRHADKLHVRWLPSSPKSKPTSQPRTGFSAKTCSALQCDGLGESGT